MELRLPLIALFFLSCLTFLAAASIEEESQSPVQRPILRGTFRGTEWELQVPENVELFENLVYGTGSGHELYLDLYLPLDDRESRPAVLFFHGGGWASGSKRQFARQAAYLAGRHIVAACVAYRLSGEAKFPAAIEDAKCAVRWMRANATRYRIDPQRIGAAGGSAGAHLAALLGTTAGIPELEGKGGHAEFPSAVQLVVAFNGVFDIAGIGKASEAVAQFLGGRYNEIPQVYALASPITHVDKSDPPFLLLHGTADQLVPISQSAGFQKRLLDVGVRAELFSADGAGHGFFNGPPWYEPTLERMVRFVEDCFATAPVRDRK